MANKGISRRDFLKLAAVTGLAVPSSGCGLKEFIFPKKPAYIPNPEFAKLLPTLKEIILEEGEEYFSFPEDFPDRIDSIEEINQTLYPEVQNSIDIFLEKKNTYPELHKLSAINIKSLLYAAAGVGFFKTASWGQKFFGKTKFDRFQASAVKYLLTSMFALHTLAAAFGSKGQYSHITKDISVDLGNSRSSTKKFVGHEAFHYLYFKSVKKREPIWVVEGFADAAILSALDNNGLLEKTKNEVRRESLEDMIAIYNSVRNKEDASTELPKEFQEFSSKFMSGVGNYSFGYSFFRIRERQLGKGIYASILEEGSLKPVEPLTSLNIKNK
ncbi:MAG: twin-arginine translocation signal domain-containing protein [archaeon]